MFRRSTLLFSSFFVGAYGDSSLGGIDALNVSCNVGDEIFCPGSPHYQMCAGNMCCEGPPEFGTFVCPSAEPGWNECNRSKRVDCVQGTLPEVKVPEAVPYFPHFDTSPDYLNIAARARGVRGNPGELDDNYYLVIADWGGCGFGCCCEMQHQVAEKMTEYVIKRREANPRSTLLFVLAAGDNFYWNGATEEHFNLTWYQAYSEELLSVPWFAVFGNHDFGNDDNTSGCPSVQPRFTCDERNLGTPACGGAKPYSTQPQGYNSNLLNANKGGLGGDLRKNFHVPDYTYYYTIPELKFELLAMDWNWLASFPGSIGGNGIEKGGGASQMREHCGSAERLGAELKGINDASTEMLFKRSELAEYDNVAIFSHYPDEFQGGANLREMYMDGVPQHRRDALTVMNFFGHTHVQECRGYGPNGRCADFLTGGGGGCCSHGDVPSGFVAISFDNVNASQVIECFVDEPCSIVEFKNEL